MHKNHFKEFIKRLWNKTWLLATGVVGFLIFFLFDLFFPHLNIPNFVYPIIFLISIIIGSFLSYRDLSRDYSELEARILKIESKEPKINVGFPDNSKGISKEVFLYLNPITSKFEPSSLIEKKRKELEEKLNDFIKKSAQEKLLKLSFLNKTKNPNYANEVEEFLRHYPEYLKKIYECSINRSFSIPIIVENIGQIPLNNLKIEFTMPYDYKLPEEHQCFDRAKTSLDQIISSLDHIREPKLFIETPRFDIPYFNLDRISRPLINTEERIEGPINEEQNKKHLIVYKIKKLIQHNPERNFDPFWIWLGDVHDEVRWEIQVRITCEELHDPFFDSIFINIKINN